MDFRNYTWFDSMGCLKQIIMIILHFSPISVPSMRFVFSAVLSVAEKTHKKKKTKNKTKIKLKKIWLLLTGCFVSMFLVCMFSVFILTVQFNLGWKVKQKTQKKKIKDILGIFSLYMLYLLLLVLYLVFWLCLNHWNYVVLHTVVCWKRHFFGFWQWWQQSLSYLNGFYHFLFFLILY